MKDETQELLEVHLPSRPLEKFEREREAFIQQLPQLLTTHKGLYVAFHEGQVVDSGENQDEVVFRVLERFGSVQMYVSLVTDQPQRIARLPIIRDLSQWSIRI